MFVFPPPLRGRDERSSLLGVRVGGPHGDRRCGPPPPAAPALSELGAEIAIAKAKAAAGLAISDVRYAAVYDSFTITLAMLLEDLGLAGRGEAAARARSGYFGRDGEVPLNTHGGLLSYGHCGVGGAMAHLVETPSADDRPRRRPPGQGRHNCAASWRRRRAVVPCQHVSGEAAMSETPADRTQADWTQADWTQGDWTNGVEVIRYQACTACGEGAIFPPQFLHGLRRERACRQARERRGDCLRDLAGRACRDAGNARACALQHRAGRYRRRLSHDGAWRPRSCDRRSGQCPIRAVCRTPSPLFWKAKILKG